VCGDGEPASFRYIEMLVGMPVRMGEEEELVGVESDSGEAT